MSIFFNLQQDAEGKRKVVDYLSREYGGVGLDIVEFIPAGGILSNPEARTKSEVIESLAEVVASAQKTASGKSIADAVIDREDLGSTVVDGGIAFPHARTEEVSRLYIAVALSERGFDFGEEGTVHIVFLLVSNDDYASLYLLSLAALAKIIRSPENRKKLIDCGTAEEVKEILKGASLSVKAQMPIEDVMKWPKILIDPDTSLQKVSYLLEENSLDCAFVIDGEGQLIGEINDLDLLRVTAADVFSGTHEGILVAKDAMQRRLPSVDKASSIADAAMRMVDLRRNRLPVIDDEGKLIGEVVWSDLIGKMIRR